MTSFHIRLLRLASLVSLACGIALLGISAYVKLYHNDLVYWNVSYIVNARTNLDIDLAELHGGQSIAQIKAQFPHLDWRCKAEINGLGDHVCFDSHIATWNGNAVMTAAFWFRNGGLAHVLIRVPHWKHAQVKRYLLTSLGQPDARDRRGPAQADMVVWQLSSGGGIAFNIDAEVNPLMWSTVLWYSPETVKRTGGLVKCDYRCEISSKF